jgi:hypothetical protein
MSGPLLKLSVLTIRKLGAPCSVQRYISQSFFSRRIGTPYVGIRLMTGTLVRDWAVKIVGKKHAEKWDFC